MPRMALFFPGEKVGIGAGVARLTLFLALR
jgi:hypothetical protein